MKTLQYLFLALFVILFFTVSFFAQEEEDPPPSGFEINIENASTSNRLLKIRVYPISMVFNGYNEYDLHAQNPVQNVYNYINGRGKYIEVFYINPGNSIGLDFDGVNTNGGNVASIGRGMYKIEFDWNNDEYDNWQDSCILEYDEGNPGDLSLVLVDDHNNPRITFQWASCSAPELLPTDRKLYSFNQQGCGGFVRSKLYGNYTYSSSNNNNFTIFPQDFRIDCSEQSNDRDIDTYNRFGKLVNNLTITKSVETRTFDNTQDERLETPERIIISPICTLTINNQCEVTSIL
ncbi:MAG: hypothetical protein K8I03_15660 [Ignavibacteria bacterium]|nr:hypothetical protein [Ignavibacteria bacterium]